jgi:peptide/nickel transport system substrate-binding protein
MTHRRKPVTVTRTELLRSAAALGLGGSLAGVLAACGGDDEAAAPTATGGATTQAAGGTEAAAGEPKRGGRLQVGCVGGGAREAFNPQIGGENLMIILRLYTHFDELLRIIDPTSPQPALALEWTPNADATVWQFKLRPEVTWHDGKPFGADDVIYSLRFMSDPKHYQSVSLQDVLLDEIKKVDDLTVEVPLARPSTIFPTTLGKMVQDGATDFREPIGTGAFMLESFTVGQRSLSVRNPNYWDEGKPYVDELEFISIDDDSARMNALLSGEINVMADVPFSLAEQYKDSDEITLIDIPSFSPHVTYMAIDVPPWDDVRVRTAMKLIADREGLVAGALSGFGVIANDLFGKGLPFYADTDQIPQRERDVEQARFLLKEAGYDGDLTVTLETSPISPGIVEAATLLKAQAAEAGVTINIERVPPAAYYDTSLKYLKMPFAQSAWLGDSLGSFYQGALLSDSPYNETHWRDPEFDELVRSALGATDENEAAEFWLQAQKIQWEQGGNLIWGIQNLTDAAAANVHGLEPSPVANLGAGYGLITAWIE